MDVWIQDGRQCRSCSMFIAAQPDSIGIFFTQEGAQWKEQHSLYAILFPHEGFTFYPLFLWQSHMLSRSCSLVGRCIAKKDLAQSQYRVQLNMLRGSLPPSRHPPANVPVLQSKQQQAQNASSSATVVAQAHLLYVNGLNSALKT